MSQVAAFSILALTVGVSLGRPSLGPFRLDHASAAAIGAVLCVALGIVPIPAALAALELIAFPVVTIVSLMVITQVAEYTGLFEFGARGMARLARGNASALFGLLFFAGAVTGTLFTNDAAVLIYTPLVIGLLNEVQESDWTEANKLPFYFAVLYVANMTGALVISNPINIIVSRFFDIGFLDYAAWMALPALASIVVTYAGLRTYFRGSLPSRFRPLGRQEWNGRRGPATACAVVLLLTLVALFSGEFTGVPTWAVALGSAALLLVLHALTSAAGCYVIARGVGWDVVIFVVGIFIIVSGISTTGLADTVGHAILALNTAGLPGLTATVGFTAAAFSALMNNHPTAGTMAMVIQAMDLPAMETKMLAFAALIGGDLGPKMLPTGSLAALMWFRILRSRGVEVSYWTYVKLGVPVTLAAVLASLLVLNLQVLIARSAG